MAFFRRRKSPFALRDRPVPCTAGAGGDAPMPGAGETVRPVAGREAKEPERSDLAIAALGHRARADRARCLPLVCLLQPGKVRRPPHEIRGRRGAGCTRPGRRSARSRSASARR